MAKKVIGATVSRQSKRFGIDKDVLAVHCDDGTVYTFERDVNSPRWRASARYERGERSPEPSRLPRAVEAHMDGRTCSGPHGRDSKDYWV
jgi:hypothetical protein